MSKKLKPKALICYKEGRTQKWIMTTDDNHVETILGIITNPKVKPHSTFMIPVEGLMFGGIWLDMDDASKGRFSFWDFFNVYKEHMQPKIEISEQIHEIAETKKEQEKERRTSRYGFISPDGKYYHCDFEGHYDLAYNICFGQFEDNNNPERVLMDKGWCKIYNPMSATNRYAVSMENHNKITDAQLKTLQNMELDTAEDISYFL